MWDSIEIGLVANFLNENKDSKAFYDKNGQFQYTTTVFDVSDVPKNIQDFINKKYKDASIAIIQEIFDGKNKTYQIELTTNTDYFALEFDEKGALLKEIKNPLSTEEMQQQEEEGVEENEK